MPVVCIAALTTKIKPGIGAGISVILPAGRPLTQQSQILPFQVMTVDQVRLTGYMAAPAAEQLDDLAAKLKLCWGL